MSQAMRRPSVPIRYVAMVAAVLSAPVWVGLVALVLARALEPDAAAVIGVIVPLGVAVLARPVLADVLLLRDYIDSLSRAGAAEPPRLGRWASTVGLSSVMGRLARSLGRRDVERERLLRASETILESLPDPVLLLDRSLVVGRANRAAHTLLGAELGGRDLATVLRAPRLLEAAQAIADGAARRDVEFRMPGTLERDIRARLEALSDEGGRVLLALHDVTEVKRTERMRADFVANASHELRTPLSALIGFLETLSETAEGDPEARGRFIAIMREQATRMSRLVTDLLSLSRIELNEHSQPTGRVELAPLLARVGDGLELQAKARDMAIRIVAAPD
ncbi:MAG: histidine kinase dimerization/phospho-acceptor domain-containing protein, partial [Alphaproteobacteria bacterium]